MSSRYANRPCEHCGEHTWLRNGTWDFWDPRADMFVVHECAGTRKAASDRNAAIMAAIAPAWNRALENWDERYGG